MNTTTIVFGTAAYAGGKIHRTQEGGHAWCLSGNGHKPLRGIIARVQFDGDANIAAEVDALHAAKINPEALCSKCCGFVATRMNEMAS